MGYDGEEQSLWVKKLRTRLIGMNYDSSYRSMVWMGMMMEEEDGIDSDADQGYSL